MPSAMLQTKTRSALSVVPLFDLQFPIPTRNKSQSRVASQCLQVLPTGML